VNKVIKIKESKDMKSGILKKNYKFSKSIVASINRQANETMAQRYALQYTIKTNTKNQLEAKKKNPVRWPLSDAPSSC
jgi:hypothetical protein